MQIHRQTQIIITEVDAAADGKGPRLQPARFYYMGMLAWAFLRLGRR
jgi:hypothetical protein